MTFKDFKTELFIKRGAMKGMDEDIERLFGSASTVFRDYALVTKKLGVKRMAEIAWSYPSYEQDKLVVWLETHKTAKKQDIEVYLLSL